MLHTILTDTATGGYLYIRVDGELTREDYERFEPDFSKLAESRAQPVPIMVELGDDFSGWDSAKALWDEVKFDAKHRKQFGRIAIVGDGRLQQWATSASDWAFDAEIRFFEHAKRANAEQWLRGEPLTELP